MPRTRHQLARRLALAGVVLGALGSGCHPQTAPPGEYGFLVLGYEGRERFAAPSDTIPELPWKEVPATVVAAGDRFASGLRHDGRCSRFFQNGTRFLLLSRAACTDDQKIADGLALTQVDSGGAVVGPTFSWITTAVLVSVAPYRRGPAGADR